MDRAHLRGDATWLVRVGAIASAVIYLRCHPWNVTNDFFTGAPLGRDFVNFWLGPRLALEGSARVLVDWVAYNELVARLFGRADDLFVFSYPPPALLLLAPVAALPFVPGLVVYTLANLAALAAAARALGASRGLALVAALSPAAMMAAIWGHFGGVVALAATLAFRLAERRPVAAGACLALVAVKPQFAAVLGAILLLSGRWRAALWSAGFVALLVAASVAAFGLEPWRGFIEWTMPVHGRLLSEFHFQHLRTTIALYTAARLVGLAAGPAFLIQGLFGVAVVAGAVVALRRHGPSPAAIAAALLAALLALPYANHYDLAIAAPALTIALLARAPIPGPTTPVLWLAPVFTAPLALLESPAIGLALALALVFLLRGLLAGERPAPEVEAAAGPAGNAMFTR